MRPTPSPASRGRLVLGTMPCIPRSPQQAGETEPAVSASLRALDDDFSSWCAPASPRALVRGTGQSPLPGQRMARAYICRAQSTLGTSFSGPDLTVRSYAIVSDSASWALAM